MKPLLVAATYPEIGMFLESHNLEEKSFIQTENFDVVITGVGMTATAFAIGRHLNQGYDLVVNVGIAGAFNRSIALGDLVNIKQDCFAELGAENNDEFITINDLGFGKNTFFATAPHFLELKSANAITVNKVHGQSHSILNTIKNFNPDVESMEGAAVFYACNRLDIPCMQVRSISNYVEPRNRENWKIGLAIKNLNEWLIAFAKSNFKG